LVVTQQRTTFPSQSSGFVLAWEWGGVVWCGAMWPWYLALSAPNPKWSLPLGPGEAARLQELADWLAALTAAVPGSMVASGYAPPPLVRERLARFEAQPSHVAGVGSGQASEE
jgi:hypothetical protein